MQLNNKYLHHSCEPVVEIQNIKPLIEPMFELMTNLGGIGLAANQIGLSQSFFIMDVSKIGTQKFVFINPILVFESEEKFLSTEGCLSYPEQLMKKNRSISIKVEYTNLQGIRKIRRFKKKQAIVVQHEIDHLLGIDFLKTY